MSAGQGKVGHVGAAAADLFKACERGLHKADVAPLAVQGGAQLVVPYHMAAWHAGGHRHTRLHRYIQRGSERGGRATWIYPGEQSA